MKVATEKSIRRVTKPIRKEIARKTHQTIKTVQKNVFKEITSADITLERQAEMMSPQDYINARRYLSNLEMMQAIF